VAAAAPVELHIVSDSTGETATRLVHALEAQFPDQTFEEVRHPRVESVEDLELAVKRARGRPAVVFYTLVKPELRDAMRRACRRARVHYCDLLGQPIDAVSRVAGVAAQGRAGARAPLDSGYFRRIEAIEFAVRYDDGIGGGLDEADVVLVGVSRTSKTPLSMYLGNLVGLTIDANRLGEIRQARARNFGGTARQYSELVKIYEELAQAEVVHRRLGCPVIDVSELSIEETAQRVIRTVEQRTRDLQEVQA
jgi:[pyruvate, water dikinase]-phosphate phosphotransferase / [pyruvate, water dikinase] kinase